MDDKNNNPFHHFIHQGMKDLIQMLEKAPELFGDVAEAKSAMTEDKVPSGTKAMFGQITVYTQDHAEKMLNGDADLPVGLSKVVETMVISQLVKLTFSDITKRPYHLTRVDNFFKFGLTITNENFEYFVKSVKGLMQNDVVLHVLKNSAGFDKFIYVSSQHPGKAALMAQLFSA